MGKLEILCKGLQCWATGIKKERGQLKKDMTLKLEELMFEDRTDETLAYLINMKVCLNMEIEKDKGFLEQRARTNWLRLGDSNTKFFHSFTSA